MSSSTTRHAGLKQADAFARRFGLHTPVLLAPMAGACPPSLSIAVSAAGGMGACGALLMQPAQIADWVMQFRAAGGGPLQLNLWIPDPPAPRDAAHEARVREFLGRFGPPVPPEAGDARPPDFAAQCEALLAARPTAISSIMGLYPAEYVQRMKAAGVAWFANVTTMAEARAAEAAGADAIVAQGSEAGGHRGVFDAAQGQSSAIGLFALLPQVVDAVRVPVIATGGVADARGAAAALLLGASAVQVGTGFLRCDEAGLAPSWAAALGRAAPEDTTLTRAFSGRWGRALATDYVRQAHADDAPRPAPYPVQRGLSAAMRTQAQKTDDVQRMQAWAGQAAGMARAAPAAEVLRSIWSGACALLDAGP